MANLSNINNKFLVTTGGNVLIGATADTGFRLHVTGGPTRVDSYLSLGNNGYIRADTANMLRFQSGTADITFYNSSNSVEHVRIKNNTGNVGIGVTGPLSPLSIQANSGGSALRFIGRSDGISGIDFFNNTQTVGNYFQSNGTWIRSRADGGFHFSKGSTPIITDVDGFTIEGMNVGIGTASPTKQLHLLRTTGDVRGIMVETTVATSYAEVQVKAASEFRIGTGGSSTVPNGQFYIYDATAGAHRFDIDAIGNVGIGTTSPSRKLVVAQSNVTEPSGVDANTGILIKNNTWSGIQIISTEATGGFITFGDNAAGFAGRIQYLHATNAMVFETAASERMRIASSGDILCTSDGGTDAFRVFNASTGTGDIYLRVEKAYSSAAVSRAAGIILGSNAGNLGSTWTVETNSSNGYFSSGNLDFIHNAGGTPSTRMRITSGGTIEIRNGTTVGGEMKLTGTDNDFTINGKRGQVIYEIFGTQTYIMDSQQFYPAADNARNIGTGSNRFSVVYSANGVNTSDRTLKKNIKECDLGIDFINSLKPKSYNFKDLKEDNDAYGKKRYGLIAQDLLQTELKDAVFGEKDGEYGLSYNDLIAPMIKAIQELKAEIDELKK